MNCDKCGHKMETWTEAEPWMNAQEKKLCDAGYLCPNCEHFVSTVMKTS